MYCRQCHKQSPENFETCAYCGAKLAPKKKRQVSASEKKEKKQRAIPFKAIVAGLVVFALVLSIAAIFTATITGSKPERVVKNFVAAISNQDEKLYYSLYDDGIKEYKRENRYYGEEETFENMVAPMLESHQFYKENCGEDYKLTYSIKAYETLSDDDLLRYQKMLEEKFSYIKTPSRVDVLSVEIYCKGEKGEYTSIYKDFWCMKIKGKWYKVDKAIFTEFEKLNTIA